MTVLLCLILIAGLSVLPGFSNSLNCKDNASWCKDYVSRCKDYPVKSDMWKSCKKTCGICNQDGSCAVGYYGADCSPCTLQCKEGDCDPVKEGECPQGCEVGKQGTNCTADCDSQCLSSCDRWTGKCDNCAEGRYGNLCKKSCRLNCKVCNQTSGNCTECKKKDKYGVLCQKKCNHCSKEGCSIEGQCIEGCKDGWDGDMCQIEVLDCEKCKNKACNTTGYCLKGCREGYWGKDCKKDCSTACKNFVCVQSTGQCHLGCEGNRYGPYCSQYCSSNCRRKKCSNSTGDCLFSCKKGWYLKNCTVACNKNCINNSCRVEDGQCKKGCMPGWYGNQCDQKCIRCINNRCNQVNGVCSDGCVDGYHGRKCAEECPAHCKGKKCERLLGACSDGCVSGYFGVNCSDRCSNRCKNRECNSSTGICVHGCRENTFYGQKCEMNCHSNCKNGYCESSSGKCNGCKLRFHGPFCNLNCSANCKGDGCVQGNGTCDNGCKDGYFGSDCIQACSNNCKNSVCSSQSGTCYQGCQPGYYGSWCNISCFSCRDFECHQNNGTCPAGCQPGSYGSKCDSNCSGNCKPQEDEAHYIYCEQQTGRCTNGCVPGTYGETCTQSCSDTCVGGTCYQMTGNCTNGCRAGWHGGRCSRHCSKTCGLSSHDDIQCNQTTGHCLNGCQVGYYGPVCTTECSSRCLHEICDSESGKCTQGCSAGWKGLFCDEECSPGSYGYRCHLTCGHCIEDFPCNRVTGSCPSNMCANGFTGIFCRQAIIDPAPSTGEITVISVTVVLAVIIVVLVAVIIVVVYRRRRTNGQQTGHKGDYHKVSGSSAKTGFEMEAVRNKGKKKALKRKVKHQNEVDGEDSMSGTKLMDDGESQCLIPCTEDTVINLSDLWNHVQNMKNENVFLKQFKELPSGLVNSCEIAMNPDNRMKNRYRNICAYDCSRVVLQCEADDPNSDYINACYIDGFATPKQYIASQGPIDVNLNDFWRMIWQQNTSKIVMLTNLVEEGRIKCIAYWPELNDSVHYGNIAVKCTSVEVLAHFTIRTFKIHHITEDLPPRVVKHFHYTSWPDRGVPTDVASLVEFYFKVDKTGEQNSGPLVVHCSAGIGRTGTYLALACLVEASKQQDFVNVFTCVSRMRHQRVNMVQTEEQYEFLHDALVEAILAGNTTVSPIDFLPKLEELQKINPNTGVTGLKEQFDLLNKVSPRDSLDEYTTAKLPENTSRNRFNDILASNYYRPYLSTPVEGGTDYINAIILPAYRNKCMFLLTQMPLKNTVVDFWRMIYENDSNTIVMLNGITQHRQNVGIYWPNASSVLSFGPFEVENLETETTNFFSIISLSLRKVDSGESHNKREIKLFQCLFWPHGQLVPQSATPLFTLMESVQMAHQGGPVTVHCIDGVERSGLYCVLTAIIDRLKIEQDVSIVQTINQMRACRNQLIRSYTQFEFCYKAVQEYFESFSLYSNFA